MEKYTFFEALVIAGIKRGIRMEGNKTWSKYENNNSAASLWDNENEESWWPTNGQQKAKIWEVEPEEIILYGACDDNGHIQNQELEAIKNWRHKPLKCDCGSKLEDKHFTVLRSGHSPQKIVFLAVLCGCGWYWLVDTEGTAFSVGEK